MMKRGELHRAAISYFDFNPTDAIFKNVISLPVCKPAEDPLIEKNKKVFACHSLKKNVRI